MSSLTHAIGGIFQPILKFIAEILAFFYSHHPELPGGGGAADHRRDGGADPADGQEHQEHGGHAGAGAGDEEAPGQVQGPGEPDAAQRRNDEALQRAQSEPRIRVPSDAIADAVLLHALQRHPGHHQHGEQGRHFRTPTRPVPSTEPSSKCQVNVCADPRYISPTPRCTTTSSQAHGQLSVGRHQLRRQSSSPTMRRRGPTSPTPSWSLGAVGLQYLQMSRLNARNPQANQANPQAAMLQKYMPLIFGFIYLNVAAILNVYFIVSSAIRIGTQEVLFRRGIVPGPNSPAPPSKRSEVTDACRPRRTDGIETTEQTLPKSEGDRRRRAKSGTSKGSGGTGPNVSGTPATSQREQRLQREQGPTATRRLDASSDNGSESGECQEAAPPIEGQKREKGALTRGVGGSKRKVPSRGEGDGARHARGCGGRRGVRRPQRAQGRPVRSAPRGGPGTGPGEARRSSPEADPSPAAGSQARRWGPSAVERARAANGGGKGRQDGQTDGADADQADEEPAAAVSSASGSERDRVDERDREPVPGGRSAGGSQSKQQGRASIRTSVRRS